MTEANWDETEAAILYNKDKESKIKNSLFMTIMIINQFQIQIE